MHVLSLIVVPAITGCTCDIARTPSASPPVSYSSPSRESLKRLTIRRIPVEDSVAARIAAYLRTNSRFTVGRVGEEGVLE